MRKIFFIIGASALLFRDIKAQNNSSTPSRLSEYLMSPPSQNVANVPLLKNEMPGWVANSDSNSTEKYSAVKARSGRIDTNILHDRIICEAAHNASIFDSMLQSADTSICHSCLLHGVFEIDSDVMDAKTTYTHLNFRGGRATTEFAQIYTEVVVTKTSVKIYFISSYYGYDWLFHTYIKIKIGDVSRETTPVNDGIREVLGGNDIHEKNYYPTSDLYILKWIADNYAKEITVRFYGKDYYQTMTIPEDERIALKETWDLYKTLRDKRVKTVKAKKT